MYTDTALKRVATHLSVDVNGIRCWSVDFQLWFAILRDLSNERHRRSAFALIASHVVHFEESFAKVKEIVEKKYYVLVII